MTPRLELFVALTVGEVKQWLACALYVACRKSVIPTVGKGIMEGNGVSLTRILRTSQLSLIKFFDKVKKWMDMSNSPQHFRERVEKLERNFEVSAVIFRKFEPIFLSLFQNPHEQFPRQQRSRKHRCMPCGIKDVFNFCWTLFIYTKGNFHMIGDNLVNSYHLLLCCLDLVFANALTCPNRKDLLNSTFKGLPLGFHTVEYRPSEEPPCIIDELCELHDGLVLEAKGIKEHYFKPYIEKLLHKKILKGENSSRLLDAANFMENKKALNREYEEYVLTYGDFDERVFLGEDADEEIGTPRKCVSEISEEKVTRPHMEANLQHFDKVRSVAPSTPLTGRSYLREKDITVTPVSSATQTVSRLQGMVTGLKASPSEQLMAIFRCCAKDLTPIIKNRARELEDIFCKHYTWSADAQIACHIDFARNRFRVAEILYYKILETVMVQETRRLPGKDMTALLEQDIFHCSLVACCLEIVLFAYSSQRTFPWIIEVFKLMPFYFYKVIEVFIRSEEGLSRDMVKHLNGIEEQILESRAWSWDSALWEALKTAGNRVPTCEEVIFPNSFESSDSTAGPGHLPLMPASPLVHPRVKEVRTDHGSAFRHDILPLSPISVHDRYSSPAAGSAKRRLFGDESPTASPRKSHLIQSTDIHIIQSTNSAAEHVSPGNATVTFGISTEKGGQKPFLPIHGDELGGIPVTPVLMTSEQKGLDGVPVPLTAQALISASPKRPQINIILDPQLPGGIKPKKTGSLALFFRKVYHLASVRLRDLCFKLDVSTDLRRKIWTCFVYSVVHCIDLMKDRHLDQLLLCAVYIMAKVTKEDRTFQDIMKCYRSQPQANSHVYRSVLLKTLRHSDSCGNGSTDVEMEDCESEDGMEGSALPRTHTTCASKPTEEEHRGDLIKFYNSIYVSRMKSLAKKYAVSNQDHAMEAPPLSPFPSIKPHPISPRRVSQHHSVYVSPHKNGSCLTPQTAMLYRFNGSPSKSLKDINTMIKQREQTSRKRAFTIDSDTESPAKRHCQENDVVLLKRLQDVISERASR
ncbi:retinoblastoma-like protein 1 [Protopterus annectens]|uniref:retinoblastoma-like protein 1 n=1 Tax=Protopterus annectens TaxID=7888 RepID=UPI001CFBCB3B|nr:retinoblastoma-like protein 1 [Protopterus annectens]